MAKRTKPTSLEATLIEELKKKKISQRDIPKIITNLKDVNPSKYRPRKVDFPETKVKFLAFGDCHMGHKEYRPDILDKMVKDAKREGCEFAINAGDTIEGMSGRDGHIYELFHLGATAQIKYFKTQFDKFKKISKDFKVYSIEATNSHGGWFNSKGNMGLDVGEELHKANSNYEFIGYDEQDLILENGLKIRLLHPGGGTAYAISYHMQKHVESISGGQKPNMLFKGHDHKAEYLFYRNINCYDVGCLQNQSIFMKKKNTPSHLGYWIVEVKLNKNKNKIVERVSNIFVPFFE